MAIPTANFLSYNPTGMNTVKYEWIRNLCDVTKTDFCTIQEHFKNINCAKLFKEHFNDFSSYVVPAARAENQDNGRPKGGLAQMHRKNLKIKVERIKTKSFRIQAQVMEFPNTRLLWINSYLPNDPLTMIFDDQELNDVLTEIENLLDTKDFDDVLWQGDLNWEVTRTSGFSSRMKQFLTRLGLVSVWEQFPISYTHVHTDLVSTSTLDHFIVNERLLAAVIDADVLHLGDNLSRHSPIMLKLNLGSLAKQKKS